MGFENANFGNVLGDDAKRLAQGQHDQAGRLLAADLAVGKGQNGGDGNVDETQNRNIIQAAVHEAVGVFGVGESKTRDSIEGTASEFLKAVPLFIGGGRGLALSTIAYGLGEVKVGRPIGEQGLELVSGMAKGFLTKKSFDVLGQKEWGFAAKGMAMGSSSRLIDTGLSLDNYISNGKLDLSGGLGRAALNAGDIKALGVDVATFGVAHYIPGALSGKLARSAMVNSTLTGATFGFTSGTLSELQTELHKDQPLDFGKIFASGAKESLIMGAAAATGHSLTVRPTSFSEPVRNFTEPKVESTTAVALTPTEVQAPREIFPKELPPREISPKELPPRELPAEKDTPPATGKEPSGYVGYFLKPESAARTQNALTIGGENIPLRWKEPTTLHITDKFGVKQSDGTQWTQSASTKPPEIKVLGLAVDATGVEALHVSVDGKTIREDGKPYHLTRSMAEGRRANESMAVVEKALKIDAAKQAGTTAPDVSAEDLNRYSYRALAPEEQFTLTAEPAFRASETTAPKEKVSTPKPEIPFDELSPKLQVMSAIKATPPDYLARNIETRTAENRMGSYFDMSADKLKQSLFQAKWEPYDPVDGQGNHIIGGGARGYRATIEGGRLGMTPLESIPENAPLYLTDPKGTGKWALTAVGADAGHTNMVTMIVGPGDAGKPVVWTFHPGEPVRPSALDSAKLNDILSSSGIKTDKLPADGPERRVRISRDQLKQINDALPEQDRMTLVKTEAAPRIPGLEALDSLPNQIDRVNFGQTFLELPEASRQRFADKLNDAVKNPDEVARTTQVRGVIFEMSRLQRISQQGLEAVAPTWTATEPVQYTGFNRKATDFSQPPNHDLKAAITSDVPIEREGGTQYVYEVKSSPRRQFGNDVQQRNNILKLQEAINQGKIAGATVELNGRVSPEFVQWLNGKNVGDPVAAPNVEVLYNMTLPSGGDYTFILKRAANNEGLRFTNADRQFSQQDRQVISGIYKAIQDRSIGDIISGTNIESAPTALAPFVGDPFQIKDLNLFNQYDQLRLQSTWDRLAAKADSDRINDANPRNAVSEYNTREYIDEATRWYQNHLQQNPQTAKAKSAYIIKGEDGINKVVDLAYQRAQEIKHFEEGRQASPQKLQRQGERMALGYTGRPEGISLDMEHIIMDATQEHNKGGNRRGRTYDQPERFMGVDKVMDYLNGQDRRMVEVQVYDPQTGKTEIQSNASEKQINQRNTRVQAENLERAKTQVDQYESRYQELKAQETRNPTEETEFRFLTSRHGGYKVHNAAIEKAQAAIDEISRVRKSQEGPDLSKMDQAERAQHIEAMRAKAAEYDKQIETLRNEIEGRYKQILGGEAEWNKIAKRMSVNEQNIIKFMYAVDAEGNIPLTEEVLRGEAAGRAAHSELAGGRNVYGAGELVFAKDATTGQWSLVEINNASGHYRPPGQETLVYVRNLIARYGIDTSRAIINDALQRGTPLVDAHFLDTPGH